VSEGGSDSRSRLQQARDAGEEPALPYCSARFLSDYLFEIGPIKAVGMGTGPIDWQDIEAWQRCTAITLPPWQARLLRSLSRSYLAMSREAEEPDCRSPMEDEVTKREREAVSQKLRAMRAGANIKRVKRSSLAAQ
jgi:hypothetical protein